ncbi:MAG: phosphoglycerate dehydrogenase [Clostridioides sp.]|jgi:phosphoglycerate dehydrogenase-like enzyme|nr:phosphoglycerate dehydrogenase [Clostridioides sp.]
MKKVLFTVRYGADRLDKVRELGYEVKFIPEGDKLTNSKETDDADVLVTYFGCYNLDIDKMKNLKYIQTTSAGLDQLPKDKISKNSIIVANNKDGYKVPIGEWIVKSILDIYKNTYRLHDQKNAKIWKMDTSVKELAGQKIGFLGTGNIAKEAAKRLKGFDVEIWGMNTKGRDVEYFDKCFSTYERDCLFQKCDVIVVSMPSTEDTKGIVNKHTLGLMKEGSAIVNIGRGDLIVERDLLDCIDKFRGVALDVFEEEPLSVDSEFWEKENVLITPHNSWCSDKNVERNFRMIYENLKRYIENEPIKNVVDIERGY